LIYINTRLPSANGYYTYGQYTGASSFWQAVRTNDGDTSYVWENWQSYIMDVHSVPSNAIISKVAVESNVKRSSVTVLPEVGLMYNPTHQKYWSGGISCPTSYSTITYEWTTNPYASRNWIVSDFSTQGNWQAMVFPHTNTDDPPTIFTRATYLCMKIYYTIPDERRSRMLEF
jgi:hypothetical protein